MHFPAELCTQPVHTCLQNSLARAMMMLRGATSLRESSWTSSCPRQLLSFRPGFQQQQQQEFLPVSLVGIPTAYPGMLTEFMTCSYYYSSWEGVLYCAVLELSFQYKRLWKGGRRGFKFVVVAIIGNCCKVYGRRM